LLFVLTFGSILKIYVVYFFEVEEMTQAEKKKPTTQTSSTNHRAAAGQKLTTTNEYGLSAHTGTRAGYGLDYPFSE